MDRLAANFLAAAHIAAIVMRSWTCPRPFTLASGPDSRESKEGSRGLNRIESPSGE